MVNVKYSASGSDELCPWDVAARNGGSTPSSPAPGVPRVYNVDAWLDVDGQSPVKVTNIWMSEIPEDLRKPLLKELGLPVKKGIVYRDIDGTASTVIDLKITDVWNGWCNVAVRLEDGSVPPVRIHSMHFAEMNSGATGTEAQQVTREKPLRKKAATSNKIKKVAGMPLDFCVFDLESTDRGYKTSEICEIAALRIVDGAIVDTFETPVFIDGEISPQAASKNKISKDMLQDAPHMKAALRAFLDFIGSDAVLVGHNIRTFDLKFIERVAGLCNEEFKFKEAIDTLTLAKRAWPDLPSYTMDNLRTWLNLEPDGGHRALKDCRDEYELYMSIRRDVEEGKASITPSQKSPSIRSRLSAKANCLYLKNMIPASRRSFCAAPTPWTSCERTKWYGAFPNPAAAPVLEPPRIPFCSESGCPEFFRARRRQIRYRGPF